MLAHQADGRELPRGDARVLLWIVAAAIVVVAHGGAVWIAFNWRPVEPAGEPPPAVMIELSPVARAAKGPPQEVAPGPQMAEAAPTPADASISDAKPDPTPPQPEAVRPVEEIQRDLSSPREPVRETRPLSLSDSTLKLPQIDKAAAALAPPPEKAPADLLPSAALLPLIAPPKKEAATALPSPKSNPLKAPPENNKPKSRRVGRTAQLKPEDKPEAPRTSAPPTSTARQIATPAAPSSSASLAPSAALASWKGALLALLNRNKRYPSAATGVGTASVAFAVDRAGVVVSARLNSSSGDPALDEEALALLRRSSPVPAPPPGFGRGVITLTVPIRFDR